MPVSLTCLQSSYSASNDRKSELERRHLRRAASASSRFSTERSRGSGKDNTAASVNISRSASRWMPSNINRPSLGSTGSRDSRRPKVVSFPSCRRAPISRRLSSASRTAESFGASRKGNSLTEPNRIARMRSKTEAKLVLRISGSVKARRWENSCSSYKRRHKPGPTRPQRPDRWWAEAWLMGSTGKRSTRVLVWNREIRAIPKSITARTPGTVTLVSATLVASTMRRRFPEAKTLA